MRLLLAIGSACLVMQAQIPAQDSRNTETPNTDTHFKPKNYRTLAEWEARKAVLRRQILSAAGLYPMLPKNRCIRRFSGASRTATTPLKKS